jgi:uncharacterized iron-regulated membrane protein
VARVFHQRRPSRASGHPEGRAGRRRRFIAQVIVVETTNIESVPPAERRHLPDRRPSPPRRERWLPRFAFYSHLWVGVVFTVVLLVISITGVLLNHKRGLGLMPEVDHTPSGEFTAALSLDDLARRALRAVGDSSTPELSIYRMDVRPRDGVIKVRLRDRASTEVTLDLVSGAVLAIDARGDVFLEKLHSGEIFGSQGILLSDAGAIALTLLLITGYWLWLRPRWRR